MLAFIVENINVINFKPIILVRAKMLCLFLCLRYSEQIYQFVVNWGIGIFLVYFYHLKKSDMSILPTGIRLTVTNKLQTGKLFIDFDERIFIFSIWRNKFCVIKQKVYWCHKKENCNLFDKLYQMYIQRIKP